MTYPRTCIFLLGTDQKNFPLLFFFPSDEAFAFPALFSPFLPATLGAISVFQYGLEMPEYSMHLIFITE